MRRRALPLNGTRRRIGRNAAVASAVAVLLEAEGKVGYRHGEKFAELEKHAVTLRCRFRRSP